MTEAFVQSLPLLDSGDVVIAGAGPAGLCAAVAAARQGARVILLERFGAVGGSLTVGHVRTCMGEIAAGTMQEKSDGCWIRRRLYPSRCGEGKICPVSVAGGQRGHPVFADTGGRGLESGRERPRPGGLHAARVGPGSGPDDGGRHRRRYGGRSGRAPYQMGRPSDGLVQPASLLFTIDRVHSDLVCTHEADDTMLDGVSYLQLCEQASRCGELPPDVTIVRLYGGQAPDERLVNANQLCRVDGTSPADIARVDRMLRGQIQQVVDFLRKRVKGFENCRLTGSAEAPGFRETRRIQGDYTLTASDISAGRTFPDVVVHHANFCFDTHNPAGGGPGGGFGGGSGYTALRYSLPLPAAKGLWRICWNAGRCLSGNA